VTRRVLYLLGGIGRRLCVLASLAAVGVVALAYNSSVNIEARWRVLPYQSLTLIGLGDDPALVSVSLPAATGSDLERGYAESGSALRLHIASNVPWKVQLRLAAPVGEGFEVRLDGADYVPLSTAPVVLAAGRYGVYDIDLDLRHPVRSGEDASGTSVRLVATIMPE
jgi:hypothetical protein